jgi:hypothetical protein
MHGEGKENSINYLPMVLSRFVKKIRCQYQYDKPSKPQAIARILRVMIPPDLWPVKKSNLVCLHF